VIHEDEFGCKSREIFYDAFVEDKYGLQECLVAWGTWWLLRDLIVCYD
jgi:hypothetical protein